MSKELPGKYINRRQFMVVAAAGLFSLAGLATGCSSTSANTASGSEGKAAAKDPDKITMVWYPNESASEFDSGRNAFGEVLEEAFGLPVELMTTTDYNVAIEAISSGKAQIGYFGAEGYIQAQKKNPAVMCIATTSDENGTLDEAKYYSRIAVPVDEADNYKEGSGYSIKNIKGKKMSFVSPSSTSGFKVPSSAIVKEFDLESSDVLTRNGEFFSEVMYGNTHQGSIVNVLMGNADVCAVDDIDIISYLEMPPVEGEDNKPGATYRVKEGAAEPFDRVVGKEFTIIQSTPVLNAPLAVNTAELTPETVTKVTDYLTSDAVSKNEKIFAPEGKNEGALWEQEGKTCFIKVEDDWYNPVREM